MYTINDVLTQLETIIADCRNRSSAMGYFPALYYNMTVAVRDGILNGRFEDGARMERLDVIFAQRYLDAYAARRAGQPTTLAWNAAFDAADADEISVLQHLLLGINAHINLDLGIAAAETCPGASIWGLQRDFDTINVLISDLTEQVQNRLSDICPPLGFLDAALKTQDEGIADFSILVARKTAWHTALGLAFLEGTARDYFLRDIDEGVSQFAERLSHPKGWVLRSTLRVIRFSELGDTVEKMDHVRHLNLP